MDAARAADAPGGTVIHAKGTGTEQAERFLGVSIAAEKERIFIVTRREGKNAIVRTIMESTTVEIFKVIKPSISDAPHGIYNSRNSLRLLNNRIAELIAINLQQ